MFKRINAARLVDRGEGASVVGADGRLGRAKLADNQAKER